MATSPPLTATTIDPPLCARATIEVQGKDGARVQHDGGRFRGVTHYDLSPIDCIPHPVFKSEKPEPPKWEKEVRDAVRIYGDKVIETGGMDWDDLTQACYETVLRYESVHGEQACSELGSNYIVHNLLRGKISDLHKSYVLRETVSLDAPHENERGDKTSLARAVHDSCFDHPIPDAHDDLIRREQRSLLGEAIKALSPLERRTIGLYYFSDEPYPTIEVIAAILGEQVPTTKKRLARAKETLRTRLRVECWQRWGWRFGGALIDVPIVTPAGVVRWYPGSPHTGLAVDKSLFLGIPTQERKLSPYYDDLDKLISARSYRTGCGVATPSYFEFIGRPTFPDEGSLSLNKRRLKARRCGNKSCPHDVILLGRLPHPAWEGSCPLCATIQTLGFGVQCPFCKTEETRRGYCATCAADYDVWRREWWSHRMSVRFAPFTDDAGGQWWAFDLTRKTLANTDAAAVFCETYAGDKLSLQVWRDQPVTVDPYATDEPLDERSVQPAQPFQPGVRRVVPQDAVLPLLSAEDRLDRQLRVMRGWQARARKKFEAFKREHKGKAAAQIGSLFAATFPIEARLCREHLCRRCGKFAGTRKFICEECRRTGDEAAA